MTLAHTARRSQCAHFHMKYSCRRPEAAVDKTLCNKEETDWEGQQTVQGPCFLPGIVPPLLEVNQSCMLGAHSFGVPFALCPFPHEIFMQEARATADNALANKKESEQEGQQTV